MRRERGLFRFVAVGLVCGLGLGASAWGDEFDTLNVDFGSTFVSNSNVFYLPAATDPNVVLGKPTRSDFTTVNSLGVRLSKPYSLQRFELSASFVDYRYKTFDFLSYSATNYSGAWRWSLTPRLRGNLTSSQTQSLNSFLDFRAFVRNLRTEDAQRVDAEYEVDGAWRLVASASQNQVRNALPIVQLGDSKQVNVDAGIRYVFASGSSAAVLTRESNGRYVNVTQPIVASQFDNEYRQRENEFRLTWLVSGKSTFEGRLVHLARTHPNFPQRDFQGLTGTSTITWGITAKTRLIGAFSRDLGVFIQPTSSYSRLDKWSLGPVWEPAPKVVARARYDWTTRTFFGAVVPNSPDRTDRLRTWLMAVDWQPRRWVTLTASLQNDRRDSNQAGLDFNATMATVAAQLTF